MLNIIQNYITTDETRHDANGTYDQQGLNWKVDALIERAYFAHYFDTTALLEMLNQLPQNSTTDPIAIEFSVFLNNFITPANHNDFENIIKQSLQIQKEKYTKIEEFQDDENHILKMKNIGLYNKCLLTQAVKNDKNFASKINSKILPSLVAETIYKSSNTTKEMGCEFINHADTTTISPANFATFLEGSKRLALKSTEHKYRYLNNQAIFELYKKAIEINDIRKISFLRRTYPVALSNNLIESAIESGEIMTCNHLIDLGIEIKRVDYTLLIHCMVHSQSSVIQKIDLLDTILTRCCLQSISISMPNTVNQIINQMIALDFASKESKLYIIEYFVPQIDVRMLLTPEVRLKLALFLPYNGEKDLYSLELLIGTLESFHINKVIASHISPTISKVGALSWQIFENDDYKLYLKKELDDKNSRASFIKNIITKCRNLNEARNFCKNASTSENRIDIV